MSETAVCSSTRWRIAWRMTSGHAAVPSAPSHAGDKRAQPDCPRWCRTRAFHAVCHSTLVPVNQPPRALALSVSPSGRLFPPPLAQSGVFAAVADPTPLHGTLRTCGRLLLGRQRVDLRSSSSARVAALSFAADAARTDVIDRVTAGRPYPALVLRWSAGSVLPRAGLAPAVCVLQHGCLSRPSRWLAFFDTAYVRAARLAHSRHSRQLRQKRASSLGSTLTEWHV